jgi:multiple sugar transport system ATP-binding protein
MTSVSLKNVRKRYDDVVAVKDVDLRVEDGEFVVLVGPSGCGKSTTLRMIAGLESVTEGEIRMNDRNVTGVEPKDRNVAMVFQNYALYPHMTARRNITFGMNSAGDFDDEQIQSRLREAADILDIADLLDRKPAALSGGERQRVALGRVIVRDPDVFLMDEPLSNLDAKLRIRMRAELAKLHDELRTTTIYVTHDQTEAMTLADRVAVMDDGSIQQVDPPQQLYDYPANRFVAEFVGDPAMNAFDVTVDRVDGAWYATHSTFRIRLPARDPLDSLAGTTATLGIRPEDLTLVERADVDATGHEDRDRYPNRGRGENREEGRGRFEASVVVTEPLGDSLLLECRAGDDIFKAHVDPRSSIRAGDTISLTYDPDRLHLFDDETGRAVYHSDAAAEGRIDRDPIDGVA